MTRDDAGALRLFSNRCPHRGATICALEGGHSRYFRCPYHAWTFDNGGQLVSLPAEDGYGPSFDRSQFGLAPVPRVDNYRGYVFASWCPDGLTLVEHLGRSAEMIDRLCDLSPVGQIELRAGWLRHRIGANWKLAAAARLEEGPPHGFVFPNLFIAELSIFVIEPVAVGEMTHRQTPIAWVGLPDELNRRHLRSFEGGFGPAGMVEPDDAAVWERLQLG